MRKRLTDRFVRTVKPTATQADYWDQALIGFGLSAKQMLADAQKGAYFETIPIVPSHVSTN